MTIRTSLLTLSVCIGQIVSPAAFAADPDAKSGWILVHEETFSEIPEALSQTPWVVDHYGDDSPWHVDHLDDDGQFFDVKGGEYFKKALHSFDLLRKRVTIGEDNWLTVEYGARDADHDGQPDVAPELLIQDGKAHLNLPAWNTGLLITATNPLPAEYRIEVELHGFDFGGKRAGEWSYDDKYNGYTPSDTCKSNFPWVRKGDYSQEDAEHIDPCAKPWGDVTRENGYYFLAIMDYAKPAPHNNIFIHNHRKVGMDIYSVDAPWAENYKVCNPKTGEVVPYTSSEALGINQIFFDGSRYRDKAFAYNQFVMPTECGVFYGDADPKATIVSTAEIQPQVLPDEPYTFAIERTKTGYVTEMRGNFAHIGQATFRYERPFVGEDGRPIWHYNQTAAEYDGAFDETITFDGPFGSYDKAMWPKGSAYPDNFIVGIPHLNYYEGSAVIDNIRLYVPKD